MEMGENRGESMVDVWVEEIVLRGRRDFGMILHGWGKGERWIGVYLERSVFRGFWMKLEMGMVFTKKMDN